MKMGLPVVGVAVLFGLAGCQPTPPEAPPNVQKFSDIELNGPMPRAYRDFIEHVDAYGALYVTDSGGGGGRIGGQPTLEAAQAGALAQCQELNPDRECILYATKTP